MSKLPGIKDLVLRDTPFAELMNRRIYNVLLIATKYDAFMLEDDGRVDEQIFNEYASLGLRYPPRFTQVTTQEEALAELADRNFELIIVMPNMDDRDIFAAAKEIKRQYFNIPIVVLTPFSKEVSRRVEREDLTGIDYIFSWLGNPELLVAIIKLIEDKWNAPNDSASVGVQTILLVEDSIRFYSSALPHLYHVVLEQSKEFSKEALNDHLKTLRMRGRPKIKLARTYEEAIAIYHKYKENMLGVISDVSFKREGVKDPLAGVRLADVIKQEDPELPFLLESSDACNEVYAKERGIPFIQKKSKSYPQDLRNQLMAHFGFGPFIIIDPKTGEEILRINHLKDLQKNLYNIPDDALRYHLSHNHFSRFFFSRAMFPPAVILKRISVEQYDNMDDARDLIFDCIRQYRRMKNEGVVAIYQKDRFDEYSNFARIGNGSLGGKGRGLAFMGTMVKRYPKLEHSNFRVNIPRTVVICTDVFDEFMEVNNLYPIALSDLPDNEILAAFERAELPEHVVSDLMALFEVVRHPIAVRSSSLLEDSHYQPFAGVYATYMIPRPAERETMVRLLRSAIKAVYASVFYKDSKAYLTATQNLIDQEKMAIVLQEVIGSEHEGFFYPTLSGVARSLNYYPVLNEEPEDGIANVALGLGKYIVDGGVTLRFSPKHPHHIIQLSSTENALRDTQRQFYALELNNLATDFQTDDAFNLAKKNTKEVEKHPELQYIVSTYDPYDQVLREGNYPGGRKIVSFANILQHDTYPLAYTIERLLHIGRKEMGRHVEIEFAMDIHNGKANFFLLQIRPIVDSRENIDEDLSNYEDENTLIASKQALGNGTMNDVCDIVYVKTQDFDAANNPIIAREIEKINQQLTAEGKGYVLVGPGRWGSSDPWLGIPIKWPHITGARVIVECGLSNYRIEPSQGTHFFQNLTSFGVGYFTIQPFAGDGLFNEQYLNTLPAQTETNFVRHVRMKQPLLIKMNGRRSQGVVMMNQPQLEKTT